MHVTQRGFSGHKAQLRQLARGIVDKYQQCAGLGASFKPVVRTAVNLDQLTKPRPALAHRMDAHLGAFPRLPVTRSHHNLASALDTEMNTVSLTQLLTH
jgi:hypothetical protein